MPNDIDTLYDRSFFEAQSLDSLQSARIVLPELFRHVQPESVVDVGCGVGTWLRAAGDLGIADRLGVDGNYVDRRALMVPEELFLSADLAEPSLPETIAARRPGRFDMVLCLEVAEHLPFERSADFVDELCRLGDLVLFSAAIPFQYGTGHINEQWPEFWAMHFRARGYACFDLLRPRLWAQPDVQWWYAQNLLVFAREGSKAYAQLPVTDAAGDRSLALVHPEAWLSSILNHWRPHRASARQEEAEDLRALLRAWIGDAALPPVLRAVERARVAPPGARDVFPFTRTEVDEPERLLARANAALAETHARLAGTDIERTKLSVALAEGQAQLDELRTAFGDVQAQLAEAHAQLTATDAQRTKFSVELADARRQVNELHTALGDARLERESLCAGLGELRTVEAAAQAELLVLRTRTATLQAANATLRGHVARHEATLVETTRRTEENARFRDSLARAEEEIAVLRAGISGERDTKQHVAALLASTSWRITAPLRAMRRLFG